MRDNLKDILFEEDNITEEVVFTDDEIKKLKTDKNGILIGGSVILLVVLFVVGWYFLIFSNPTRVYKKIMAQSMNLLSSFNVRNSSMTNVTVKTDMEISVGFSMLDQEILNFINKTTGSFNYQIDELNKKAFFKLDVDYDKEKLLNYDLIIDGNSRNMYVYLEDLYDKYLAVKLDDELSSVDKNEEFESINISNDDFKKIQEIITKELTKIVEYKDCYKEDDFFVFEIKILELMERIEDMLDDLANNKEFLECFEDEQTVKEFLAMMEYFADDYSSNDSIKISTSFKYNKLEKMIINFGSNDIFVEVEGNKIDYSVEENGESLIRGYFKIVDEKNTRKLELFSDIPMVANVRLKFEIIDNGEPKIKVVDNANVKLVDELTEDELYQILVNLQNSKIYELMVKLEGITSSELDNASDYDVNSFY